MAEALVYVAFLSLGLTLATNLAVPVYLRRRRRGAGPRPPISILKPLKGVDDGLFENLASFAAQRYPRFEIVFGVADPRDPACDVIERLRQAFPDTEIRVSTHAPDLGRNPKVSNLAALSRLARHPCWLISDSNTRVHPDYLAEMVKEIQDPRVGLVTSVLTGVRERGLGALLENLHLNSFVASAVCAAQIARSPIVIGKSMLFKSRDLAAVGGFDAVRDMLAEDHALGLRFRKAGFKVALSPHVVSTVNEGWTLRSFVNRHLRWAQIRRRMAPLAFFTEPLLQPVWWATALALAGRPTLAGAIVLTKVVSDSIVARRLNGVSFPPRGLLLIPAKDLLIAALWLVRLPHAPSPRIQCLLPGRVFRLAACGFTLAPFGVGEEVVWIGNTHLHPYNPRTRARQAESIAAEIRRLGDVPIVFLGDLNTVPKGCKDGDFPEGERDVRSYRGDRTLAILAEAGLGTVKHEDRAEFWTYPTGAPNRTLDYVLFTRHFEVESYRVVKEFTFSDHYPVAAELRLRT